MRLDDILIRYILNSLGLPTIETELVVSTPNKQKITTIASSAIGMSCGGHEQKIINNQGIATFLQHIKDVVRKFNRHLLDELQGLEIKNLETLDEALWQIFQLKQDGLHNTIMTSVSIAGYKAYGLAYCREKLPLPMQYRTLEKQSNNAKNIKYKLPRPLFNLINGGMHAARGGFVQEFWVIPLSGTTFEDSLMTGLVINESLSKILREKDLILGVGDEGGWTISEYKLKNILDLLTRAIDRTDYELGRDVILGMDVAASVLYDQGRYRVEDKLLSSDDMIALYADIVRQYPVGLLEDPLAYNDISGWRNLYELLSAQVLLIGDDLLATQTKYLSDPHLQKTFNAVLAKPNQAGTISQLTKFCDMAHRNNLPVIISHRSGETADSCLSNLAVDLSCQGIKAGGLMRSERLAKYNQLLRIEEYLSNHNKHGGMYNINYKDL